MRDARGGLEAIASELDERGDGLVALRRRVRAAGLPPPKLLGAYDPILLGWTSREPLLGEHQRRVTVEGLFHPFALVGGRAAATWRLVDGGVVLDPLRRLTSEQSAALAAEAEDVRRYLGGA